VIDAEVLYSIGLMVGAAAVLVLLTRPFRIPTIILYILAGLLLGPLTGWLAVTEVMEAIAEVGIALLLFLVGLELSFSRVRDAGPAALVVASLQMAITFGSAFGLALLLGFETGIAVILGIAMMFSSTVVVVKLLGEQNETQTIYGRLAIGVLLVQDLVVVIVLTILAGLASPDALEMTALAGSLVLAFLGMAGLLCVALLASRYILPAAFHWMSRMPGGLFIWALLWCFLFVEAAELMDLSVEIGAFLAGISLAQLPHVKDLERRVHPLMNFFIAVFFVSLGIQMELGAALEHAWAIIGFSLLSLLGKPILISYLVARRGLDEHTSFTTGVTLAQISEFGLIFAAMALGLGFIDAGLLGIVAVVALITMGISSFMIMSSDRLYEMASKRRLLRFLRAPVGAPPDAGQALRGHIIVVGMNPMGRYIVTQLCARGEQVAAVDTDPLKLTGLDARGIHGDASNKAVLELAGLSEAKLVVSALQIESANNLIAFRSRRAGVPCAIHAFDQSVVQDLRDLDVDFLIDSKFEGTRQMIQALREHEVLA